MRLKFISIFNQVIERHGNARHNRTHGDSNTD